MATGDETDGGASTKMKVQSQGMNESAGNTTNVSHSQIATQPYDADDTLGESVEKEKIWGQLLPHCGSFQRIDLIGDSYKIGRAQNNHYIIRETDLPDHRLFLSISKTQCEIRRVKEKDTVVLKDLSSNGTWIDGFKLGKGNERPLLHDSEICFAGETRKVFIFRSMEENKEKFPPELSEKYTVSKLLGRGACGEVRLGFRVPDLFRVAIKIINKGKTKTKNDSKSIMNEVKILKKIQHPCIIRLVDCIDTKEYLYIILELAEGGELFDEIIKKTRLNEKEAKLHFYQMASAIQYLHGKNICHRDLKPENILLCSVETNKPVIKITDMGLSKLVDLDGALTTFCGTPNYLAPEVIKANAGAGPYSLKVDCWSLGVVLYMLLSGVQPFTNDRNIQKSLPDQIVSQDYVFYSKHFANISWEAKDLIARLLKANPDDRLSADEIMSHPWLADPHMRKEAEDLMKEQIVEERQVLRQIEIPDSSPSGASNSSVSIVTAPLKRLHVNSDSNELTEKRIKIDAQEN